MPRIAVFKGQSQYDVLRHCADEVAAAFTRLGHVVHVVDFLSDEAQTQWQTAFLEPCALVFGFNAPNLQLTLDGRSPYEAMGVPYVGMLVDHPVYHLDRILLRVPRSRFTCVDRTHPAFVRRMAGPEPPVHFLPHAGCRVDVPLTEERALDLLFPGSYTDPRTFEAALAQAPPEAALLLREIADAALRQERYSIEDAADEVLHTHGLVPDPDRFLRLSRALWAPDGYARAQRRLACLRILDRAGIPVQVYGTGWDAAPKMPTHRFHAPVPFRDLLGLMARAKLVLNINPSFPAGAHERVFSAMLGGAVSVSDGNPFLSEEFEEGREILTWRWNDLEELPDRLRDLLGDDSRRGEMAEAGRLKSEARHTWQARAEVLLALEGL